MINYVNNSYDNVLKPCDAQKFSTLTQSEQTERLILAHRAGEPKAKGKLPALTYMGVFDNDKYKAYLAKCEGQGTKPRSPRHAEFMRPTGLLMLDFDHIGRPTPALPVREGEQASSPVIDSPQKMWEQIYKGASERGLDLGKCMALAHITPSGDGLRLVVTREKGKTIAEGQYHWVQEVLPWLGVDVKCDDVCKDISRLSFAPMKSEILYFNPSLLFGELPNAEDYPDGTIWGGTLDCPPSVGGRAQSAEGVSVPEDNTTSPLRGTPPNLGGESQSFPEDYNGVEYKEIVRRLEEQLGGAPAHGARNSFIFTMACNLRYICNDDAAWVASILPTYGEDAQKHRMTIQSAINRPMSREMPETLKRALGVAKACADHSQLTIHNSQLAPPQLPGVLPEPIAMLVAHSPAELRAAVAMAVFPPLGAYVKDTRLVYADGRQYEPTFMNVLVAEQSAGKSAVNTPIQYILADMKARDMVALEREQEWKNRCASISNTQDKPERPKGLVVQVLPSDMTNAAFVQRLADADGHFLYTQMDEVELLNALKTNGSSDMVSAVLRLAFDCGQYGQVRVAANAINAMVNVRWNWNASSTVQRVRKYFAKNIADGTLSRLSFATIIENDDDWGMEIPEYEEFGEHFADVLLRYLDRLKTCTGVLRCPEAAAWARELNRELVGFAIDAEDRSYARLSRRGILMGFFRAMLLYIMNGMRWSKEIEDFATWSVKYDLWCKMRFFRDMLHHDLEGERKAVQRGPVGLLAMLPREFTREQVRELRIVQGMKPDPRVMINNWLTRGLISRDDERGLFVQA